MATETPLLASDELAVRPGYQEFLDLEDDVTSTGEEKRYARLAAIINNNADKVNFESWAKEDADVIIGLYDEGEKVGSKNLAYYLNLPLVCNKLTKLTGEDGGGIKPSVQELYDELKTNAETTVEALRTAHPDGADLDKSILAQLANTGSAWLRSAGEKLGTAATATGHFLWADRNKAQRAGLIITPFAATAGILGAVAAKSAALTTAGTFLGNMLPGFVTAFAASHAVPLAAVAFYVIAAALGAAALLLLLAGTIHQNRHEIGQAIGKLFTCGNKAAV